MGISWTEVSWLGTFEGSSMTITAVVLEIPWTVPKKCLIRRPPFRIPPIRIPPTQDYKGAKQTVSRCKRKAHLSACASSLHWEWRHVLRSAFVIEPHQDVWSYYYNVRTESDTNRTMYMYVYNNISLSLYIYIYIYTQCVMRTDAGAASDAGAEAGAV